MPSLRSDPVYYRDGQGEPPTHAPTLQGDLTADVAVIGGGLAGLSVALSLVERGQAPVVLEGGSVGDGASARSGGFVQLGWAKDDAAVEAALGASDAAALFDQAREAVALVGRRVARLGIRTEVGHGVLEASFTAGPAELESRAEAARRRHRVAFRAVPRAELREHYGNVPYLGGILDPVSLHLDPLALARGYGRAVLAGGGRLFERTPVSAIRPEGDGLCIVAGEGQVHARQVVLATSVYGDDPDGRPRQALLPVRSYVVATAPLGARLSQQVRAPWAVFDDRFATGYWRPLPDGRLLWGGKVGLSDAPRGLESAMRADLARIFPALADVPFDHVWSGRMGFTRHRMPLAGRLSPGLWLSTGFAGHGLAATAAVGEMLAAAMLSGDRRIELIERFGRPWTGGRIGPVAAQAVYGWLSLRDRLRAALRGIRAADPGGPVP